VPAVLLLISVDNLNARVFNARVIKPENWQVFDPIAEISYGSDPPKEEPNYTYSNMQALRHLIFLQKFRVEIESDTDASAILHSLKDFRYLGLISAKFKPFDDDSLSVLGSLRNLDELHIYFTQLTDKGVEHLRGHPSIRILDLAFTKVSDESLSIFETIPNLEELNLSQTGVTVEGEGIKQLRARLPHVDIHCADHGFNNWDDHHNKK